MLPQIRLHDLRHTHVTLAQQEEVASLIAMLVFAGAKAGGGTFCARAAGLSRFCPSYRLPVRPIPLSARGQRGNSPGTAR